jgi:ferritin-like metal-binding protein YciE
MPATSLDDLYSQQLQLLLDAEQQGLDAMPQLVQTVHDPKLRDALQMHRRQSEEHVRRLERLIEARRRSVPNRECVSMRALIEETQSTLATIEDPDTIDAYVIGAQQAIEHHEIASYGTARTWAQELGYDEDADLLQQTLDEEGNADQMLTQIAERRVNREASQGADREVGIASGQGDRASRGDATRKRSDVSAERGADMR